VNKAPMSSATAFALMSQRFCRMNFAVQPMAKRSVSVELDHAVRATAAASISKVCPFRNVRLGASISNFGSDLRLDGRDIRFSNDPDPTNEGNVEFVNALYETEKFPLPLSFRVGLATEIYQNDNVRVTVGLDALHPNDNTESINTGAEVVLNEMLFLRGGYSTLFRSESEEGLTLGGGLHYRLWGSSTMLKIDYAYADFGLLKNVQRFSLGVSF